MLLCILHYFVIAFCYIVLCYCIVALYLVVLFLIVSMFCIIDEPDNYLQCVGYWQENQQSYLVTYDTEDSVSKFRCWVCQNNIRTNAL